MPYYSGDFYTGDYYQGDPGFWGWAGRAARAIGGGPVGWAGAAARALGRKTEAIIRGTPAAAGIASRGGAMARAGMRRVGGAIAKHPVLTAAGAAGTIGVVGGRVTAPGPAVGMAQRGFHISKYTGQVVRNKRMRVTNPRALRRAIRRAMGFARLAKRVLRFTSPRAPRGRAVFKYKRRKKI